MVKQIIAMAAACVIFIPAYALSEEVKAEAKKNMDLIFRVGHIRGQPEKPSDPLVEREFKILNSDSTTVQVRTEEDFPQVLKAQQRLAIFLDELPAGKYLFRTIVAYGDDDVNVDPYAKREVEPPGLTVLFNGNIISRRDIRNGSLISGVIIPEWLEKGGNIIQIRNESHGPICFNWLSVKPYSAESLLCLSRTSVKKEKAVEQLPNEIQICYLNSGYDASLSFISEKSGLLLRQQTIDLPSEMIGTFNFEHEQDIREHYGKSSYVLLNGLTGWLYSGGTKINIVNIENSKAFFDDKFFERTVIKANDSGFSRPRPMI